MKKFRTFEELNDYLKQEGDVLTISMEVLRNTRGAAKLGSQVKEDIADGLKKLGIKYYPKDLPSYQHQCVRIYRSGTDVDKLYDYMMNIEDSDNMKNNEIADKKIKEFANAESKEIIRQIRAIIGD